MVNSSNPVSQSFRVVLRAPARRLTDIGGGWSFGAIAMLLVLMSSLSLVGSVKVSQAQAAGWRSNNPTAMAQALADVLVESGPAVLMQAAWVLPMITLLWLVFGAAGRATTLNPLGKNKLSLRTAPASPAHAPPR